jgi:hypothetical protein
MLATPNAFTEHVAVKRAGPKQNTNTLDSSVDVPVLHATDH